MKEQIKFPNQPYMWYCPVCNKFDLSSAVELMAIPEHIPYRGVDIGKCKSDMIKLYTAESIVKTNETCDSCRMKTTCPAKGEKCNDYASE